MDPEPPVLQHFSDIHCGMRGITKDALERMNLQSQSWEYASEMVLKSVHMQLRTTEVPSRSSRTARAALSHHKREGWLSPFKAAWINLRAMFIYGSDFFLLKPGIVMTIIGLLLTLPLTFGDLDLGSVTLSLNWQFLGVAHPRRRVPGVLPGLHRAGAVRLHRPAQPRWRRVFPYTRTVLIAFGLVVLGILARDPAHRHLLRQRLRARTGRHGPEPPRGDRAGRGRSSARSCSALRWSCTAPCSPRAGVGTVPPK